jgi:aminoglycoside phosphotransferase (APT) family kinase protein
MGYVSTRGDVGADLHDTLTRWLPRQLSGSPVRELSISHLSAPDAGYSGKTVFFTAAWISDDGSRRDTDLVLRLQSTSHQLFTAPDAPRQAEVMRRLARHHGIAVPQIVAVERDPTVLGSPFYLMRRVNGRTPSDVPSWHKRGWTVQLSDAERETLCDNGLRALVAVHNVTDADDMAFLREGRPDGTALQRYLRHLTAWHKWCRDDIVVGSQSLQRALAVLLDQAPGTDAETVVWGDARVGNMSFADDLSVNALFDWESASTGPSDIDVGWWLMFERYLCESLGFTRMAGIPDDDELLRRYVSFGGRLHGDIAWFKLLAAVQLSFITNRLARLLVRDGLNAATARSYPENAVGLVRRYLSEL